MNNEEAIAVLQNELDGIPFDLDKSDFEQALEIAIKAIRNEPIDDLSVYSDKLWKKAYERGKAEARPQGDLISREALKKAVENLVAGGEERLKDYYENGSKSEENEWIGGVYDAWELINNAPTVDITEQITIKCVTEEEKQKLLSALRNARLTICEEAENDHL